MCLTCSAVMESSGAGRGQAGGRQVCGLPPGAVPKVCVPVCVCE